MNIIRCQPVCEIHQPVLQFAMVVTAKYNNCLGCKQSAISYVEGNILADKELFEIMRGAIERFRQDYKVPLTRSPW